MQRQGSPLACDTIDPQCDATPSKNKTALPSPDWTDERLVKACLDGDERAWALLIARYERLIRSFPRRYGADPHDSADVFQLVCVELFQALPILRNVGSVRSWIATVAAHQAYRWKRRHVLRLVREGYDVAVTAPVDVSAFHDIERAEREEVVRCAIARLTAREQQLIRLLFYQDPPVSYDEVATRLGLATGSIGATRSRCLERLRRMLAREASSAHPVGEALRRAPRGSHVKEKKARTTSARPPS